jgi:PAS domain S-box-containing protein
MPKLLNFMQHNAAAGWFLSITLLLVLLTDSMTQLGFAHGILYVPLIALAGLSANRLLLHSAAAFALVAVWLGFFIAPNAPADFSFFYVVANRAVSCLSIILLWWLSMQALTFRESELLQQHQVKQIQQDLALANRVTGLSHWWLDNHRKMVRLDPPSQQLLGVNLPEITLAQFVHCFESTSRNKLSLQLEQASSSTEPEMLESKLQQESPHPIWIRIICYQDPADPDLVRGILQNIQHYHDEASRLAQQQRRFQQLADSLPVKVWTASAEGQIDFASETFAQFCGRDTQTILADWLAILHPDDQQPVLSYWQQCVVNKTPYKIEFRILRADGHYVWHLTSAVPIFNEQGEVLYWFGSAMDISEQKKLWQHSDQLRLALFQTLDEISDAFLSLDQQLNLTFINQQALELLRSSKNPLLGKSLTEVFYRPGKDFSVLTAAIQRSFIQQQAEYLTCKLPDSSLDWTIRLYPNASGINVLLRARRD